MLKAAKITHESTQLKARLRQKMQDKVFMSKPSQHYGVSPKYDNTQFLLAARNKRAHPALTQASKAGNRLTYHGGTEG